MSYVSYSKGSNNIKINIYGYKIKDNKKDKLVTFYFGKSGNKIKFYHADSKGKKSKLDYFTHIPEVLNNIIILLLKK